MEFIEQAESIKAQIYAARDNLNSLASDYAVMSVMSQHSLAVSFLPTWLRNIEPFVGDALIKVQAANLHDSLESFLQLRFETAVDRLVVTAVDAKVVLCGHTVGRVVGVLISFAVTKLLGSLVVRVPQMLGNRKQLIFANVFSGSTNRQSRCVTLGCQR